MTVMSLASLTATLLALTRPALFRRATPRCCAADDVLDARPSGASAPRGFGGFAPSSDSVLELHGDFEAEDVRLGNLYAVVHRSIALPEDF